MLDYGVTVLHIMVGLERMLDYRGVGLARFHCITSHYVQCLLTVNVWCGVVWCSVV